MLGLTTAGAAGLGAPAGVWIVMLVLAAVFGVIAAMRWAEERQAAKPGPPLVNPEPSDSDLHVLLSHGRGIKDDYLLGGGLPSISKAQRDESYRWTRDTASALNARDPALAKRFLAAQSHRARLSVLADILGVDEPSAAEVMVAPETSRPPQRRRGPFGEDSYFPQVRLTNDGTEPAEGVRVEIVSWKHRTPDGLFKDSPHFDHPRPLRWEGTTDVAPRRLGPGETARLDLAFTQHQEDEPTHELVLFSYAREGRAGLVDALLGEGSWQPFPRGTYRATVRTTAENAEPHEVALEVQFDAWDRVAVYEADHHVG